MFLRGLVCMLKKHGGERQIDLLWLIYGHRTETIQKLKIPNCSFGWHIFKRGHIYTNACDAVPLYSNFRQRIRRKIGPKENVGLLLLTSFAVVFCCLCTRWIKRPYDSSVLFAACGTSMCKIVLPFRFTTIKFL